ncbi:esterase [Lactococcus hodotermopsidis]|uniref:Esterase n=1 Tax=Pseudolactococcus hodotermopsidis TaxID=2709157 RepID=A0A6A0BCY4_9LACT|nr:alpha/beta hydrolase family protein [Lactococcus hodotermopsidis]GFH41687.1 esterase [Lactococcus hodotermopsidis]
MAILQIEYYSEILGMVRNVNVIYPETVKNPDENVPTTDIPVLYLLHGMSGNQDTWLNRSGIDRLVRNTNLAVVMPSTDLAWYTNTTYGARYFDAIASELPKVLQNFLPNLSSKREKNFIAGLSMGGYGAFKLALATNQFSYAASLSGAISFKHLAATDLGDEAYWQGIFGDLGKFDESDNSVQKLAADFTEKFGTDKPKLYAWCGYQDFLYEANHFAVKDLQDKGFDISYDTSDGKHEWYYWTKMLDRVLDFLPIKYNQEERLS